MSAKIEKILDKLYLDFEKAGLTASEYSDLRDCITNLQEENEHSDYCNEQLRKKITNLEYKIEKAEEDNKQLKELCDKYEEEHSSAFKLWKMKMEKMPCYEELKEKE